jgi:hypothetical protein
MSSTSVRRALLVVLLAAVGCQQVQELAQATGKSKVSMTLKNGHKIEGTLLQEEDGQSLVQVNYGSVRVNAGDIQSVEKTGVAPAPDPGTLRLSRWDHCMHVLSSRPWSRGLVQVPATVINVGNFKNVPYFSHRSGEYELNIYGDPDQPACLELGLYRGGPHPAERKECLETLCLLLGDPADRQTLRSLGLEKGSVRKNGLLFEVTPSTAPDAFGGWWLSVCDERALGEQRATEAELALITTVPPRPKTGVKPATTPIHDGGKSSSPLLWNEHDLKMARPRQESGEETRVYKRGVHRKNGTYVVTAT